MTKSSSVVRTSYGERTLCVMGTRRGKEVDEDSEETTSKRRRTGNLQCRVKNRRKSEILEGNPLKKYQYQS